MILTKTLTKSNIELYRSVGQHEMRGKYYEIVKHNNEGGKDIHVYK